jgi:hypothetical protein
VLHFGRGTGKGLPRREGWTRRSVLCTAAVHHHHHIMY